MHYPQHVPTSMHEVLLVFHPTTISAMLDFYALLSNQVQYFFPRCLKILQLSSLEQVFVLEEFSAACPLVGLINLDRIRLIISQTYQQPYSVSSFFPNLPYVYYLPAYFWEAKMRVSSCLSLFPRHLGP